MRNIRLALCCAVAVGLVPTPADALTIRFEALDLADAIPGEDRWQYSYLVSDFPFAADFGFDVVFDPDLYRDLESPPPPVNADWDALTFQPVPVLGDDGLYDAVALVSNPSVADPFVVSFVWLGSGTPGSQPFVVFDADFAPVETGDTLAVPEPGTLPLLLGSLLLTSVLARRAARSERPASGVLGS